MALTRFSYAIARLGKGLRTAPKMSSDSIQIFFRGFCSNRYCCWRKCLWRAWQIRGVAGLCSQPLRSEPFISAPFEKIDHFPTSLYAFLIYVSRRADIIITKLLACRASGSSRSKCWNTAHRPNTRSISHSRDWVQHVQHSHLQSVSNILSQGSHAKKWDQVWVEVI